MRLLSKSEIDAAKAKDRQRDINEGKKLATRVDTLRNTVSEEEANLTAFRDKSVTAIQQEIDAKVTERDTLDASIAVKRAERDRLLKPLDAEWARFHAEHQRLEREADVQAIRRSSLETREVELVKKEREVELELGRAENIRHSTSLAYLQATRTLKEAQEQAMMTRLQSEATFKEADARLDLVLGRELAVAGRERDVANHQANMDAYEERLFKRELEIRGDWQNLQESIKQNGKRK